MNKEHLLKLIKYGENINVEFKSSQNKLNRDVFDTVCAFLNRKGGHLFLGIKDDGTILGIAKDVISVMVKNLVTQCNNPSKLYPPYYLSPEVFKIGDEQIIYIFVPESSQVHNTAGEIFDRNDDGDFNVTKNHSHISQMYLRKQKIYTENRIFPYATLDDLNLNLIQRARIRAKNENGGKHPWFEMDDLNFLKSAQLFKKDFQSGKEGITLAGILLFGKDNTILSVLPHHKTDAIFREAIGNILIHREYSNAFPAKMIIEKNRVWFENANRPNGFGPILPEEFTPMPKNPIIARMFKEIGLADELGSGVRNLFKYAPEYSNGRKPELIEGDIFKISIPICKEDIVGVNDVNVGVNDVNVGVNDVNVGVVDKLIDNIYNKSNKKIKEKLSVILKTIMNCEGNRLTEIIKESQLTDSNRNIERHLKMLKDESLIKFKGNAPKTGGYYTTDKLKIKLELYNNK